jgi:hypothetical protein
MLPSPIGYRAWLIYAMTKLQSLSEKLFLVSLEIALRKKLESYAISCRPPRYPIPVSGASLLCYNFARTICHYVFESVKSTASERR